LVICHLSVIDVTRLLLFQGINLSGGQKSRVALARAVYQDRDVYLLDDPLSAVDAHVAKHIFTNVIGPKGLLANKTRILVTHGLSFLKDTDVVVVMRGGSIMYLDTYERLLENSDALEIIQEAAAKPQEIVETESSENVALTAAIMRIVGTTQSKGVVQSDDDTETIDEFPMDAEVLSVVSKASLPQRKSTKGSLKKKHRGHLIEEEKSALGRVKFSVYMAYFNSMGIVRYFVPFAITLSLNSAFMMARSLWLTDWSNDNVPGVDEALAKPLGVRLGVYAILGTLEGELFDLQQEKWNCLYNAGIP
ncbi:hypothetical protein COOONC_21590, partial [Cooperia oncophora]